MGVDPLAATIPVRSALAALSPGDIVAERYRVEARLGEGTMGVVYRVEHVHMHKTFALKVLGGEWGRTPGALARFEREARAAASIATPHVAQATDFGLLADGSCFLVLEYVDGRTLRSALKRGALQPGRALRIARGVGSALAAAHAMGVIHRDLKPENIMLVDRDGDSDYGKVLDFGLAKIDSQADAGPASSVLTRHGALVGTPAYMSPEQAIGEGVDPRADLYAVGVILFEMLTGGCPFRGDLVSVLRQHVMDEAPPLPSRVGEAVGARVGGDGETPAREGAGRALRERRRARRRARRVPVGGYPSGSKCKYGRRRVARTTRVARRGSAVATRDERTGHRILVLRAALGSRRPAAVGAPASPGCLLVDRARRSRSRLEEKAPPSCRACRALRASRPSSHTARSPRTPVAGMAMDVGVCHVHGRAHLRGGQGVSSRRGRALAVGHDSPRRSPRPHGGELCGRNAIGTQATLKGGGDESMIEQLRSAFRSGGRGLEPDRLTTAFSCPQR
jgi:serine/threonine protein kinase